MHILIVNYFCCVSKMKTFLSAEEDKNKISGCRPSFAFHIEKNDV